MYSINVAAFWRKTFLKCKLWLHSHHISVERVPIASHSSPLTPRKGFMTSFMTVTSNQSVLECCKDSVWGDSKFLFTSWTKKRTNPGPGDPQPPTPVLYNEPLIGWGPLLAGALNKVAGSAGQVQIGAYQGRRADPQEEGRNKDHWHKEWTGQQTWKNGVKMSRLSLQDRL